MTLTDTQVIRAGRTIAACGVVLAVGGLATAIALGRWQAAWDTLTPVNAAVGIGFGALVWTVLPKQPRNRFVWVYAVAALFGGLYATALAVLAISVPESVEIEQDTLIPADLDVPAALSATTLSAGWIPAFLLPLTVGLLLFPTGLLPSPRWRWALRFQVAAVGLAFVFAAAANNPWSTRPVPTPGGTLGTIAEVFINLALLSALLGIASLVASYRNGDAVARHQIRWVAFGGALVVAGELAKRLFWGNFAGSTNPTLENALNLAPLVLLIASFWIAVAKYRLYEIDVIISKSVTYLGLAAAITGLYAAVVIGPLLILGRSDGEGPGLLLPIVATAVVAVLFEPIRARMQRWANRLVYGDRATPHEVLSQVTSRLADGEGRSIDDVARLVAGGTGAELSIVWLDTNGNLDVVGQWPAEDAPPETVPESGELTASVAVISENERLGVLTITKPRNDPITPADRELLDNLAAGAGLSLRNIHLNRDLEARAIDVRDSRRRLIAAQDSERHRLERDLHDGAQQQVVALKVKLGIAKTVAQREDADDIADRLIGLADETQSAVDALRAVAHGIYPPLLESEGLEAALRAVERTSGLPVEVRTHDLERYERPIEETAYFCVTETLQRARMSGATSARVDVHGRNGDLIAAIDLGHLDTDIDLRAVADRLDAAGGSLAIGDQPVDGHRVVTSLPIANSKEVTR